MNELLSAEPGQYRIGNYALPRPVVYFAGTILLLAFFRIIIGSTGANRPANVALAIGDGLMSVLHDDESLKNMVLIFTKNGRNNDGTAELRDYGAGLGRVLFGGKMRAGGKLYFHEYRHLSGVVLNGGPLDVELSNANEKRDGRLHIQGNVIVSGVDQPVPVQLNFVSPGNSYSVEQLAGKIKLNGTITTIEP